MWEQILQQKSDSKVVRQWAKHANHWKDSDQLVEALFAFSRQSSDDGPLRIYLMLSAIDSGRPAGQHLSPETVRLLAQKFSRYGNQYLIFSEFQGLNDDSITRFLKTADTIDRISNVTLRANALGIFQSNVGLWQILARQGQIPAADLNGSWQAVISPFAAGISLLGATIRLGPDLGAGVVASRSGQIESFPGRSGRPAGGPEPAEVRTLKKFGRNWRTEFVPYWTVNAWFHWTRCWLWARD